MQSTQIVTTGTGASAQFIRLPKGRHRVFCRWASGAGSATLQDSPIGAGRWADMRFNDTVANVTANDCYTVDGGCDIRVNVATHTSALTVTTEQVES